MNFILPIIKATVEGIARAAVSDAVNQTVKYGLNELKNRLLYTVRITKQSVFYDLLNSYLLHKYPARSNNSEVYIQSGGSSDSRQFSKPLNEDFDIRYSLTKQNYFFKFRNSYIYIEKSKNLLRNTDMTAYEEVFTITSIEGEKHIEEFAKEVIAATDYRKHEHTFYPEIYVNRKSSWGYSSKAANRDFSTLFFKQKEDLIQDLDDFEDDAEFYKNKQQPYKRGYALYGPPGNGKSSIIAAMAQYTQRNINFLSLASVEDDTQLLELFNKCGSGAILAIEDFDSYFDGRNPKHKQMKITYSGLINAIAGVSSSEGLMIVITTNKPEVLDDALVRKGRIDKAYNIDNPEKKYVQDFMSFFFDEDVILDSYKDKCKSFSSVQSVCLLYKDDVNIAKEKIKNIHKLEEDLILIDASIAKSLDESSGDESLYIDDDYPEVDYLDGD
jgi:predicted AAA+ superfamily ATPase